MGRAVQRLPSLLACGCEVSHGPEVRRAPRGGAVPLLQGARRGWARPAWARPAWLGSVAVFSAILHARRGSECSPHSHYKKGSVVKSSTVGSESLPKEI